MNGKRAGLIIAAAALFSSGAVLAQEEGTDEEADTTIRLMGQAEADVQNSNQTLNEAPPIPSAKQTHGKREGFRFMALSRP